MVNSENMARELGYVDTIWGRKRRLPNIQLEPYEFTLTGEATSASFDPLFDEMSLDNMCEEASTEVDEKTKQKYIRLLNRAYSRKEKESVKAKARAEGIVIKDNGGYIAEATRQCVNSRVQGSAADMTKKAMILVGNDPKLKEWGFKLLLPVHDELIGECPEENMAKVAKRFSQLMVEAASDLCVPSKCDVEIELDHPYLPHCRIPEQYKNEYDWLVSEVKQGLRKRDILNKPNKREYIDRVKFEGFQVEAPIRY